MSITLNQMELTIVQLKNSFVAELETVKQSRDAAAVENLRVTFMGRKSQLVALTAELRELSKEDKPAAGKLINEVRQLFEQHIGSLQEQARHWAVEAKLAADAVDVTLPVADEECAGSLHPVNLMRRILIREFRRLGFTVYDGPELEYEQYNFTALNVPEHHPARDMQDTFFVKDHPKLVLRTHTSPVQIHAMLRERPPLRVIAPGRVYRVDSDPTHTPMFHQIEAIVVDRNISFAHLKGTIDVLLKAIYGQNFKTRFRPSYFPFTEPSAEVDMMCVLCEAKDASCRVCKGTGWVEVGGCGMVHPNVFEAVNYDSEELTGFAFGFGIDRLAMLKYKLNDLRMLFEGNYRFLSQFSITP